VPLLIENAKKRASSNLSNLSQDNLLSSGGKHRQEDAHSQERRDAALLKLRYKGLQFVKFLPRSQASLEGESTSKIEHIGCSREIQGKGGTSSPAGEKSTGKETSPVPIRNRRFERGGIRHEW